ncbi:MAG: efflux RND transporter periplasmic adaptor subunit [Armatimonadota bacterium]|nr:efflux RND transporter periplasmic adaptor subunit [Armatimonadota bacterium]MDR7533237.1 efflux RND transporter periplasmic adaptor subunit [Armatimonadota bacterium]MDR7536970.1 efflux RND transporter periplasmic adaptor subunit [Armatimonadota bacterium]
MRRWWIVVLLVGVVAGVFGLRGRRPAVAPVVAEPAAVPVEVSAVAVGPVARTVEITGTVTSARLAELFPKISGRVAHVYVQDGAQVAAGAPVVALEAADQRAEVAQAEAAVAAAQARLAALQAGPRPQEKRVVLNAVAQAEDQVRLAETQLAVAQAAQRLAEDTLRRQEQLYRDGAVAQVQVDQARLQADEARARVRAAQMQLEIARTALDSARQQWSMAETGAREEEIRAARAQVAQAQAALAFARQRLASMVIRAPFAGRVSHVTASVGDYLVAGDFAGRGGFVAIVYDDREMEVEVQVGERDLPLLAPGQPASLRLETAAAAPVPAVVRVISPAANAATRTATVRLRLQAAVDARPGTFARGVIVVERRERALLVPRAAVVGDGRPVVRVVAGDVVQVRPVVLGVAQGDRVEIREGVAAGEQVVVLGPEALPAGTRVRVVRR